MNIPDTRKSLDFIKSLPKQIGEEVTFNGTRPFWFSNIIEIANKSLVVGEKYIISKIEPASSWTAIELEGIEGKFNYHWFS